MTASALNLASIAPAGQLGATAPATAGAGGAPNGVGGFDALLAALFPQGAPTDGAPAEAAAPGAPQTTPLFGPAVEADDAAAQVPADAPTDGALPATDIDTDAADADAAAAIVASLMVPAPASAQPAITASTDAHAPHAWGRDKAKGTPAAPAILHANLHADLAGKAERAAESTDEATGDVPPDLQGAPVKAEAASPAAPGSRPAPQAAAPAVANVPAAPPPVADASPELAAAPPPPQADAAPLETAPPALQAQAMAAGQTPRAEPAPQSASRPAKAERGKASVDANAPSDLTAVEAADKPVHAKAVEGAAKTAAASVDAGEPKLAETEAAPDAPEASLPAETRAAAQTATPAAHTTHAVRGSPETVANLAAQIVKKLEGQSTRFDLELNPQGLGKVDVRIEIGAHGQLSAAMLFDNAQAAQDVKARVAELQRALEQAGFDLSGGLSFDVAGDRGQQGQAWQDQGEAGQAFRGNAFRAALETAGEVADAATQGALRLRRGVNAGLDLRI